MHVQTKPLRVIKCRHQSFRERNQETECRIKARLYRIAVSRLNIGKLMSVFSTAVARVTLMAGRVTCDEGG